MILLYNANEETFANNGLGAVSDALACVVTEEGNGAYELEMTYPVTGVHYSEILARNILFCKPNPYGAPQPFRIYKVTRPLNGRVAVFAYHISYDLSFVPVSPFTANSVTAALAALKNNAAISTPFTFWTDKSTSATMTVAVPSSIRSLLGGQEGSVLDTYRGEYEFDRFTVKLWNNRGQNRGVSIRYGKNLTSLTQEENISNVYTGVYPYWAQNDVLITLPEKKVELTGYDFSRILPLDLTSEFQEQPTEAQLRARAQRYITENNIGVPKVSIDVSFVQLAQTAGYEDIAPLEEVRLFDTVNVFYPKLGVTATAKVIKTEYDVLLDKYKSVSLGDARANIADTIAANVKTTEKIASPNYISEASKTATEIITGNKGGYVILHSSTGTGKPDEILIMDTPDINTAQKVWRWNNSGLGYSSTGYNGNYGLAMTINGEFIADFIKTGKISSLDGKFIMDLDAGTVTMKDGEDNTVFSFDSSGNVEVVGSIRSSWGINSTLLYRSSLFFYENGQQSAQIDVGEYGIRMFTMLGDQSNVRGDIALFPHSSTLYIGNGSSDPNHQNRIIMDYPAIASGSANARFVQRSSDPYSGKYSLGWVTSSRRYKKNIRPVEEAGSIIDGLRAITYEPKSDLEHGRFYGFIAEEVEEVEPLLCDYVIEDGEKMVQTVQYDRFTSLLVKDAQETHERLKTLEAKLKELEDAGNNKN